MFKTSLFKLQLVCPGCNQNIAVAGITDTETCQNCGRKVDVLKVINENMFGLVHKDKYMTGFLSGSIEQMGGTGAYKLSYSSAQPYCEECFTSIDENSALEAINNEKPYECSCGHKMPVRKADGLLKEFHPKAAGVLNDAYGKDSGKFSADKDNMIVFKCMTCGAGLELNSKTKRNVKCGYCDNDNYLPDTIWTKLHPDKEVQPVFIILDVQENDIKDCISYFLNVTALRAYSRHFDNFIREYFEKPFINESVLSWFKYLLSAENNKQVEFNMDITKIQKNFLDNIKLGYSSHPAELKIAAAEYGNILPEELQLLMAGDKDENVRLALVKNKNLSKSVIKKLQNDPSQSVKESASKIKKGIFSKLFG